MRVRDFGRRGIRWRLARLYSAIFAVGLVVFCAALFRYFQGIQQRAFDGALYNFAVDIGGNLEMDFVGRLFVVNPNIVDQDKQFPFQLGRTFVEIRDVRGQLLSRSRSLGRLSLPYDHSVDEELARDKSAWRTLRATDLGLRAGSPGVRSLSYLVQRPEWREPLIVQIAVPLDLPEQEQRDLLLFFALAIPGFLVVGGLAGVWMSKRALKPVHEMTLEARSITGVDNLNQRIPLPQTDDEIHELALTFNGLLERLDYAFTSQDRFVSNASHQLKTPLTILKGELEFLRRNPETAVEGLASAAVEIDRLIKLVQDLLLLARLEAGRDTIALSRVRLDEALLKVVARMQKLVRPKGLRLITRLGQGTEDDLETEVRGDEELLESMLENFVENAIKYSPPGQAIEISLISETDTVRVHIRDHGPGIPASERQRIFERFTRGQPSNIVPGSGLGLSIAAEIARLHGAEVEVSAPDPGPGTLVCAAFPRA